MGIAESVRQDFPVLEASVESVTGAREALPPFLIFEERPEVLVEVHLLWEM